MPRYEFRMPRIHVTADLAANVRLDTDRAQANYLRAVMRVPEGGEALLFNGRDGEWRATVAYEGRKDVALTVTERTRAQTAPGDLHYLFAPLKQGRLDYMVQKAVEMGASHLRPVVTEHTQVRRLNMERLRANVVEAAEQCGILALPELDEPQPLDAVLADWDDARRLVFCDEGEGSQNPLAALTDAEPKGERRPLAVLIGPEGGFSQAERAALRSRTFVTPVPLGPRVLRADTAAVAALAVVQAKLGDWR